MVRRLTVGVPWTGTGVYMPENDDAVPRDLAQRLVRLVGANAAEADTSAWVRDVLCDLCGWPKAGLGAQVNEPRGPVDWHARVGRDAVAHIEVKRVGRPLTPDMILKYLQADARAARRVFGVLTNGTAWEVWLGGRWFADAAANPIRLFGTRLPAGPSRSAIADLTSRLADFPDRFARRGLVTRWLAEAAESEELLTAAALSPRAHRSWARAYPRWFSGRLPSHELITADSEEDGRTEPKAVAAALVLRTWPVAKVVTGEMACLTGSPRFKQTKRRIRATQTALARTFPLLWAW